MLGQNLEVATLAGGCFWCTEAIFKRLRGVESVTPGYTGGNPPPGGRNPTYEEVCSGTTGHAEAIQIVFDPRVITYQRLLEVFWALHDPTTPDRQGSDVGTQYRSAIFYHSGEQKTIAEGLKIKLESSGKYKEKIVTEIVPFTKFYPAEEYHRDYYTRHSNQPYCQIVIDPKIQKLYKEFGQEVKKID